MAGLSQGYFVCDHCSLLFERGDEHQAQEELERNFGDVPKEECARLCDDCYAAVVPWALMKDSERAYVLDDC